MSAVVKHEYLRHGSGLNQLENILRRPAKGRLVACYHYRALDDSGVGDHERYDFIIRESGVVQASRLVFFFFFSQQVAWRKSQLVEQGLEFFLIRWRLEVLDYVRLNVMRLQELERFPRFAATRVVVNQVFGSGGHQCAVEPMLKLRSGSYVMACALPSGER